MVGNFNILSKAIKRSSSFWEKRQMIIIVAAAPILFVVMVLCSCTLPTESERDENDEFNGQIVSSFVHAVLKPDSTVWTWGFNSFGTLGNGTTEHSDVPVKVLHLKNVVAIDFKEGIGVAADDEGDIWFWGSYMFYFEDPDIDKVIVKEPVKISELKGVTSIDIIHLKIYFLKYDGTVWYITFSPGVPRRFIEPVKVTGIHNITKISVYLALSSDGTLKKLRDYEQSYGGLADGIQDIADLQNFYNRRTVVLKEDGTVWAWGKNDFGQLGNGSYDDSKLPVKVSNLTDVAAISANYDFNLALKEDGTVWYWGLVSGAASIGQNIPVKIENLDDVELIYADLNSIVRKNDGTYWLFNCEDRIPKKVPFD